MGDTSPKFILREGEINLAIKTIDRNTEIVIRNNTHGGFFYESRTQDMVIDLNEYGDEDRVLFGELVKNASRLRKVLNNLNIVIVEVISDEDVTIKDVVERLKIQKAYEELLELMDETLDNVDYIPDDIVSEFVLESSAADIEKIFDKKKSSLHFTVAEAITELYKTDEVFDINKMHVVSRFLNYRNPNDYWNEVEKL